MIKVKQIQNCGNQPLDMGWPLDTVLLNTCSPLSFGISITPNSLSLGPHLVTMAGLSKTFCYQATMIGCQTFCVVGVPQGWLFLASPPQPLWYILFRRNYDSKQSSVSCSWPCMLSLHCLGCVLGKARYCTLASYLLLEDMSELCCIKAFETVLVIYLR